MACPLGPGGVPTGIGCAGFVQPLGIVVSARWPTGPSNVYLTAAKRKILAASAMAIKARGGEPTPIEVIQRCKKASFNPRTKRPFCEKTVQKVFFEDCYDFDPGFPWKHQAPLQKVFIPDDVKGRRLAMAQHILRQERSGQWWFRQVVWFDPCASIIPGSAAHPLPPIESSISACSQRSDRSNFMSLLFCNE